MGLRAFREGGREGKRVCGCQQKEEKTERRE